MTRRTLILGIFTVLVVIYGAWDLNQTRSRQRSTSSKGAKVAAAVTNRSALRKNISPPPSSLPGGDAHEVQKQGGDLNKSEGKQAVNPRVDLLRLPRVADLTPLQRQRMEMEWDRDPFVRGDLEWESEQEGLRNPSIHQEADRGLALKGIVRFGARCIAIINDKTYLPGELAEGWRVVKIISDRVVMQRGDERLTLFMQRPEEVR
ncbi:MAG: hypothetical protein JRG73_02490 [Deltaproteobacteria bacterium]|nr:hypothetical protein [Deltaproteobacteria bacterium]